MTAPEFLAFSPYPGPGEAGFYHDFLGVRTRLSYMPLPAWTSGHVFGYPGPDDNFLHSHDEWVGTLRSVLEANDRFVAIELGAGWGPWLVSAYAAARQRGIRDIKLVGVEGLGEHVNFMRQHLADNGIAPHDHKLIHGIVGARDGTAYFPVVEDAVIDWGAEASFAKEQPPNTIPLRCVSLSTLIAPFERVDLIHCDVQGAEEQVLPAAMSDMSHKVRRVVVGTHGRGIEQTLFDTFYLHQWRLEAEVPCTFSIVDGHRVAKDDGTQVWCNPRLA